MRIRLVAAAVVGLAPLALVPAAPAGAQVAAEVAETGWWSRRPGAAAQEGSGFEVAAALGSEQSVAALRVRTSGEVTTATLAIEETGGVGQEEAPLAVCTTTAKWKAANPGPYDEAPKASCEQSVELTRADDGASWTADIGILLTGAETSLMVVPGTEGPSGLPVGPGYQVTFGAATVEAAGGGAAAGGLAPPAPEQVPPPSEDGSEFGDAPSPSSESSDSPASETPAADPGSPESGSAGGAPTEEPVAAGSDVDVDTDASTSSDDAVGEVSSLASGPVASDGGGEQPWGRLFFLVPLCVLVGVAVAYGRPWLRERDLGRFLPG